MSEIYAMIASALEILVPRSEYKLINFIVCGSFRRILNQFRRPEYKKFPGGACPGTPLNGLINMLSLPLSFGKYSILCWRDSGFPGIFSCNFAT